MIKAVVFDLDDTLIPELEYVKSGFRAIAKHFVKPDLYDKMLELFFENKSDVFSRAGLSAEECAQAVAVYRSHNPDIRLAHETETVLNALKQKGLKIGIITDGRPDGQRNKIEALGLDSAADCIIVTDELGGTEFRKPCKVAYELISENLNVAFDEMIYVGDNPAKDFYIGAVLPIKTVRLVGSTATVYSHEDYLHGVKEHYRISSLSEILDLVLKI